MDESLEVLLEGMGLPVHLREDLRLWLSLHGFENLWLFPPLRERYLIENAVNSTRKMDDEWVAANDYSSEVAKAFQEYAWKVRRAGEKYLFVVAKLLKEESHDRSLRTTNRRPQTSSPKNGSSANKLSPNRRLVAG